MTNTLRGRLTVATGLTVAVTLGLGVLLLRFATADMLVEEFRAGLETKARTLGTLLSFDSRGVQFDFAGDLMPEYTPGHDNEFFQLWGPDGSLLELSENLDEPFFADRFVDRPDEWYEARCWNTRLPDGRRATCIGLTLSVDRHPASDVPLEALQPEARLLLVQERETLEARLSALTLRVVIACVVALVVALLLMRWVLRRGLLPLERLAEDVSRIGLHPGHEFVREDGLALELGLCARKVNELVGRLSAATEEQKRVANGLAHELRTPIATLRSATDLVERWPDDEELRAKALRVARDVAAYLGSTIAALLRFSRLREGEPLERKPVDVAQLVNEVVERHAVQAQQQELRIEDAYDLPVGCVLLTDEDVLGLAYSNLLENAVHHAPKGGWIVLGLSQGPHETVLFRVSNAAPDLQESDLPLLCEPFWQKDAARSNVTHAGLGLSLVKAMVEALGGRLELSLDDGWFQAQVILPARSR